MENKEECEEVEDTECQLVPGQVALLARLDYYLGYAKDCQEVLASVPTGAWKCGLVAII